jgi:uncharacterized protein (TIGR03083 family)
MSTDSARLVTALRRCHDRVAAVAAGLDASGARGPSYDADWTMAQVFSHLGSQAEIFDLLLDAGLTGAEAPGRDAFPPIWDAWNGRSPEDQVTDSVAVNEKFVSRLEGLDDAQLDSFALDAFDRHLDAPMFLRMRLSEQAVHGWDLEVALDPSATVDPGAVELLMDGLPAFVARVGKPSAEPATVQVSTTDPARRFALVTDGVRLEPWSERAVDGVLELSAEELLRLAYGRLDPDHSGSARLDASELRLDDLRAVFPGI